MTTTSTTGPSTAKWFRDLSYFCKGKCFSYTVATSLAVVLVLDECVNTRHPDPRLRSSSPERTLNKFMIFWPCAPFLWLAPNFFYFSIRPTSPCPIPFAPWFSLLFFLFVCSFLILHFFLESISFAWAEKMAEYSFSRKRSHCRLHLVYLMLCWLFLLVFLNLSSAIDTKTDKLVAWWRRWFKFV